MKMKMYKFLVLILFGTSSSAVMAQCIGGEAEVIVMIHTDDWGYECYWEITPAGSNCSENTLINGGNTIQVGCTGGGGQDATTNQGYADNADIESEPICLTIGTTYTLHYVDDYGDGGAHFELFIGGYPIYEYMGLGQGGTFDFMVEEAPEYDVQGLAVATLSYVNPGDIPVIGNFFNRGSEVITSVEMSYMIDGGAVISGIVEGLSIAPFTDFQITHPVLWNESANSEYEVEVYVSLINGNVDLNLENDISEKVVTIGPPIPNILDDYIGYVPEVEVIAGSGENISNPRDLDFHPVLTRNELWVILKSTEASGGKTVKISNAGESDQSELLQQDGNAWHFMSLPTGIAFSNNDNFATSPGVFDSNHDGGQPFTGPTLWSSDPDVYAQESGGNGSHLDMLHESPYSMGIAWEVGNKFWVTCGDHDEIMSYDFQEDHGPGNSDHADGIIYKYQIEGYNEDQQHEVPDHLIFDHSSGWLYACNSQQNRVIRINTNSGTPGEDAVPHEATEIYAHMENFEWEVFIDQGLNGPTGIDIVEDRMVVSNYYTGDINLYDIGGNIPILLTTIPTGSNGIMGLKIGPDGKIWYVNSITDKVMRVTFTPVSVEELASVMFDVYPNPSSDGKLILNIPDIFGVSLMQVTNQLGEIVYKTQLTGGKHTLQLDLINGVYNIQVIKSDGESGVRQVVIGS